MIKILSIDGGGIRGIIPALVLAEIEKQTGKPAAELFDVMAGTSTGGILALGLNKPGDGLRAEYSAADLVALYEEEGPRIFARSLWRDIETLHGYREERYDVEALEEVLNKYFGNTRLSEALTNVLVTSYDIERRLAFFFKSGNAINMPDYDFLMKQAARATSAAPTFFEPAKIVAKNPADYYALVDGGVFANNPALCAYAEAKALYPDETDFMLVSLGTGELTRIIPYEQAKDWGMVGWAHSLLDIIFDGVSQTVDYQLRQLLPTGSESAEKHYYRFQARLTAGSDELDDTDCTNIRELKLSAQNLIREKQDDLQELCFSLQPQAQVPLDSPASRI